MIAIFWVKIIFSGLLWMASVLVILQILINWPL